MIVIGEDRAAAVMSEGVELFEAHFAEVSPFKTQPLDPDFAAFLRLEREGKLKVFSARDDGVLVGYAVFVVAYMLHYKTVLTADLDLMFLSKPHRAGMIGFKLFKFARQALIDMGCQRIRWRTKTAQSFGVLLERMGAVETERVYEESF